MLNLSKLLTIIIITNLTSCSFFNKSTVTVPINSNPPGASVFIDGKHFGQTPVFAELRPDKNYRATISKKGYNSSKIDMETWYSVRNGKDGDGKRCLADSIGVLPMMVVLLFNSAKCSDFKKADYFVNLTPISGFATKDNQPKIPKNKGYYYGYSNDQSKMTDNKNWQNQLRSSPQREVDEYSQYRGQIHRNHSNQEGQ